MPLADALGVAPGVTAVIGSGGKTTLLRTLGAALAARGHTVILCTSTKIYAFDDLPGGCLRTAGEARELAHRERLIWAASPAGSMKWGPPHLAISDLSDAAQYVLVEADGSAGRPLKAHRATEPVIPKEARQTILVLGAKGFGVSIAEAAHCPALYAKRAAAQESDPVSPAAAARVLMAEGLHDRIFVNQVETREQLEAARCLAKTLGEPVIAGALRGSDWSGNVCLLS